MTALDLLTVVCAVLALGAAVAFALLCSRVARAANALESAVEEFRSEAVPAVVELRDVVRRADGEVARIDELVGIAGSIGERVDAATEVTYRALTAPVIKGAAIASGTRRVARRLRTTDDARDARRTDGREQEVARR